MPHKPTALKSAARRTARTAIRKISPADRQLHSSSIRQTLSAHFLPTHDTVLAFAPLPLEPDLLPLITSFPKIRFAFPVVTGKGTMTLHHATSPDQFIISNTSIPEPDPSICPLIDPSEITLAIIPALAFDPTTGRRLGHGGGFYDRLLADASFTAETVGIAFACQLTIPFPVEPHDQPVSALVTETTLTWIIHEDRSERP